MSPNARLFAVLPLLAGASLFVQGCQTLDSAGSAVTSLFQTKPPAAPPPATATNSAPPASTP